MARNGRLLARVRCARGHLLTMTVRPLPPPPRGTPAHLTYISGVAVGYALARHHGNRRLAKALRRMVERMPHRFTLRFAAELLGMSVTHLSEMHRGRRPKPLRGIYRDAAESVQEFAGRNDNDDAY